MIERVEGCFARRELRERVEGLVVSRALSESVDGFLERGAVGRADVAAGRDVEIGRVGGTVRVGRVGLDPAGRDTGRAAPVVRGRGTVAGGTAGFETAAFGRLNIGSSKSSSSTISPITGKMTYHMRT